ncbi:ABC transporter ATP-binding protein [Cardiobacteriaceae bacterium TAE3-ERU3]|nr:ABC transporter ATP-binding protein [Cardiobacteriaceae bacterium TAE3-ERU3]
MIRADNLIWNIKARRIIDDVSLTLTKGETVALLGPNGSGKSSLIRLIAGLRPADSGNITLDDRPLDEYPRRHIAQHIAVLEQEAKTPLSMRAIDVVMLGRIPYWKSWQQGGEADRNIARHALQQVGMQHLAERNWSDLSGGERQRIQLAKALAQETDYLLLDEPTNHLDIHHQLEFLNLLRQTGKGCLIALHDLNLASIYSDRTILLTNGCIKAQGNTVDVLQSETIATHYRLRCEESSTSLDHHPRFHFRERG